MDESEVKMGGIMSTVLDPLGLFDTGADDAAKASASASKSQAAAIKSAAELEADYQNRALAYLMQQEQLPTQARNQALNQLMGLYGITPNLSPVISMEPSATGVERIGDIGTGLVTGLADPLKRFAMGEPISRTPQETIPGVTAAKAMPEDFVETTRGDFLSNVMSSPIYERLLAGKDAGEEAILRSAASTGGLRSGNVQENLYDYNTQLENQAFLQAYQDQLAGLQGLAGIPSNANAIASLTGEIGSTLMQGQMNAANIAAQSQLAQAQMGMQGQQNMWNNLLGIGQLGLGVAMFSDRRLKKNIRKICSIKGINWYAFDWNAVANKMGLFGTCEGAMADEIYKDHPEAIKMRKGFMVIDYQKLGLFPVMEG